MSVVFVSGSGAGISTGQFNIRKDISAQIDEGAEKQTFDVYESYTNLRVIYNGRDQTTAVTNFDYENYRFTLDFVPVSGPNKKELLVYFDKP